MVVRCNIKGCKNIWYPNGDITFHSFPKNENMRKLWIEAIPMSKFNRHVNKSTRICSAHFKPCAFKKFTNSCRNYLRKEAIPDFPVDNQNNNKNEKDLSQENIEDATCHEITEFPVNNQNNNTNEEDLSQENIEDATCHEITEFLVNDKNKLSKNMGTQTCITQIYENYLRNDYKTLVKRLKRSEVEIQKLKEENRRHQEEGNHMKILEEAVHKFISEDKRQLLWNEILCNSSRKPIYNDYIKQFAMTLYFYSPKAYEFVRETIKLPHFVTLRKWMAQYNCDPGFLQGPFLYLQKAVKEENCYLQNVGLIIDAMAIRSQLIYGESRDKILSETKHPVLDNTGVEDLHEIQLLKAIVLAYIKCRIAAYTKKCTETHIGNRINARQKLTKAVLFYNI